MPNDSGATAAAGGWSRRRIAGVALVAAGALSLGYAATGYARGLAARDAARAAWDAAEARRAVLGVQAFTDRRDARASFTPGAPVARLVVPRLGIDEVVVEGVGDDQLRAGPGHLPGSALPGEPGNAVISAHRDRHFHALGDLRLGDTVRTTAAGAPGEALWVVTARRVVDRSAPALFVSAAPRLTLTTCWPVRYFGPAPERLIVSAERLSP